MTLWSPPIYSDLPLSPTWRALGRQNTGVEHYCDAGGWRFKVWRLYKQNGEWIKTMIADRTSDDALQVVLDTLHLLPGITTRIALLSALLEDAL